ncbi:MAG: glycosyltransferase [bacterium]|nr:glycosyltransferase [bacterium]
MSGTDIVLVMADTADLYPVFRTRTVRKLPPRVPLGLCYLAACLREASYRVSIIDNYLDSSPNRDVARRIAAIGPEFVGFSVTVTNEENTLDIARRVKRADGRIRTICGGPQATIMPLDLIEEPCVDYVIAGEGERSLPLLLDALRGGQAAPEGVPGLHFKGRVAGAGSTPAPAWVEDLDALPLPARDLVAFERYHSWGDTFHAGRVATVSTSRGCPFRCTFCASEHYFPKRYRFRCASSVADEIEHLISAHRADGIFFREDCFTVNRRRTEELCRELIARKTGIRWECEARVDTLDRELMELMHEAGCRGLWCGIESGSPRVLEYLQKGITVEQVRNVYTWAHEIGLGIGAGFMVGVPGETMEDAFRSLALAVEIEPLWAYFQSYVGYPRSRLYDEVKRNRWYVREVNRILDVETEQLKRSEIRALESYLNLEFNHHKKGGTARTAPGPEEDLPPVSVIVPARDAERTLEECLVSLVNLDYPREKLDIVVVDNGSNDRTGEIIRRFPVIAARQEERKSSYASRNAGLDIARGEIIAFTDSDCVTTRGWLRALVAGFEDPAVGCCAGEILPYEKGGLVDEYLASVGHMSHREMLAYEPLPRAMTANLAFRRLVFERCGPFDAGAISGGDSEMVIRMLTGTDYMVRYAGDAVVYHRHRTRLRPFMTQFIRYGWGEARLLHRYPARFRPRPGMGLGLSFRKAASDMKALVGVVVRRKGSGSWSCIAFPLLDILREVMWHLGLQLGLFYRICKRG